MKAPVLKLNKYRPDFNDPRVKRRVNDVLAWARPLLVRKRATPVSSHELTKVFGNQRSQLAAYLRANLLVQSGRYVVKKKFFNYEIKRDGFTKLSAAVAAAVESDVEIASDLYGELARGRAVVQYSEPSPGKRRYHAVQNLPRDLRAVVFSGWRVYDIEAAAPNLVLQYAKQGLQSDESVVDDPYPALSRLVSDKARLRAQVAASTGLAPSEVKRVLNGLFFGAKLQPSPQTAIFSIVGGDKDVLAKLKGDETIQALIQEAKRMWERLLAFDAGRRAGAAGQEAKRRMAVYLSLERQVVEAMEGPMTAAGVRYVLMHDGFMADRPVDVDLLRVTVRNKTGFEVSLSESVLGEKAGQDATDEIDVLEDVDQ